MPKRWERELRRLGDLDAPVERIRARSARPGGSQGPPLPSSTRQRLVAGIVAFGAFFAAAAFLVQAIDPTPDRTPGAPPTTRLELVCGPDQVESITPRVEAQEDGLHLIVTEAAADDVLVMFGSVGESMIESGVTKVGTEGSIPLPPGQHEVWCGSGGGPFTTAEFKFVEFEILDPLEAFDHPMLSCSPADRVPLARTDPRSDPRHGLTASDEVEWIANAVEGVRDTDRIARVGYRRSGTSPTAWFEIERDGQVIAWLRVGPSGPLWGGEACAGSGVGGV